MLGPDEASGGSLSDRTLYRMPRFPKGKKRGPAARITQPTRRIKRQIQIRTMVCFILGVSAAGFGTLGRRGISFGSRNKFSPELWLKIGSCQPFCISNPDAFPTSQLMARDHFRVSPSIPRTPKYIDADAYYCEHPSLLSRSWYVWLSTRYSDWNRSKVYYPPDCRRRESE